MLQTQTISTGLSRLYLKPKEEDVLELDPAEVVDIALHRLQSAGVELIEWRALLYHRMGVPIVIKDYSYVVPDEKLQEASELLSLMGLSLRPPSKFLQRSDGDFQTKGGFHRITKTTLPSSVQHLALYPLSFSTLSLSELEKRPPNHMASSRISSIYVPSPPVVYASLLRMMLNYPRYCSTMTLLRSDLSELIGYQLLHLEDGYVDPDDDEIWASKGVDRKLAAAATVVRNWGVDSLWRPGEEWIGDALTAIVVGTGNMEYLPWRTM